MTNVRDHRVSLLKIDRLLPHALACLLLLAGLPAMADRPPPSPAQRQALVDSLTFRGGTFVVPGAHASIALTPSFKYLDASDARTLLEQIWDNPPDPDVLGMIVPDDAATRLQLKRDIFAVAVYYNGNGRVPVEDVHTLNEQDLFTDLEVAGHRGSLADDVVERARCPRRGPRRT